MGRLARELPLLPAESSAAQPVPTHRYHQAAVQPDMVTRCSPARMVHGGLEHLGGDVVTYVTSVPDWEKKLLVVGLLL